jgi:hypothetical protein
MFDDIADPYTRLIQLEYESLQHAHNISQCCEQLNQQSQVIEQMARQLKDYSLAIMDLYSRENELKKKLEKMK